MRCRKALVEKRVHEAEQNSFSAKDDTPMRHAPGQVGEIALDHLRILLDHTMELLIQKPSMINPTDYRINDEKKFVAEAGKAISRLWKEDQNRRKLIETRIRKRLPAASEEEIARRIEEDLQSETHYPGVDEPTLRMILDCVAQCKRLEEVNYLSHSFPVGNKDPAEDDLKKGKAVGAYHRGPKDYGIRALIAAAVGEVKVGRICRKEKEREWIYAQILVPRPPVVQKLDKKFFGTYGREKPWDEEAKKTDQPISLGEMLGRLQEKMKDEHLTVVREFGEPPWRSRHNLIPQGTTPSEQYSDYLNLRGQIEHFCVLKFGPRFEPFCEPVELPVEKYGEAAASLDELQPGRGDGQQEKDGPLDGNRLRWHGKVYDLRKKEWLLLNYMWNRDLAKEKEVISEVWEGDGKKTKKDLGILMSQLKKDLFDRRICLPWELYRKEGLVQKKCSENRNHDGNLTI